MIAKKIERLEACTELLKRNRESPFLEQLVTCDETWINHDNHRLGRHWVTPGEQPKRIPKPPLHQKKTMLCVWWSAAGIIHHEYLTRGTTITASIYCAQLQRVHDKLRSDFPELAKNVVFLHDNARPHAAALTKEFLEHLGWDTFHHLPYLPDISPSDYHLFLSLKTCLQHLEFDSVDAIDSAVVEFFRAISGNFYRNGIYKLVSRWEKVIQNQGDYFE